MSGDNSQTQTKLISEAISAVLHDGLRAVLATLIDWPKSGGSLIGAKLLIKDSGETVGSLGNAEFDKAVAAHACAFLTSRDDTKSCKVEEFAPDVPRFHGASVLFERVEAEPQLVICGAGHVGASLAKLAALLGYQVTLIDDRAEFVTRELFAATAEQNIELVLATSWADAAHEAVGNGRGVAVAIVTRGHKQDEDCLRAVLAAGPGYVGMIGSKRRTNIVLDKLREEGSYEEQLKKVHAPIGLDIAAVSPEEVALAILAEVVAERRGGSGGSLSDWRRK